jgi:carbamoyl-phosphate synthase large subunit
MLVGLSLGAERTIQGNRYVLSTGYSQGVIIKDEEIQAFCENLIQRINVKGPANIQLRVHSDGTIKIFEVHPRFSGTTSIRAQAGFNEVDLAIRNFLLNEPITRQTYQTNVAAIRAFQNQLVPLEVINKLESEGS